MHSIFKDLKDELLYENVDNNINNNKKNIICPEIKILLNNVEVIALVDTGSQISAISEQWYLYNKERLGHTEVLSLANTTVKAALGVRSKIIKKQLLLRINMHNFVDDIVMLVIPGLNRDCILGIDILKLCNCIIKCKNNDVMVTVNDSQEISNSHKSINNIEYDEESANINFVEANMRELPPKASGKAVKKPVGTVDNEDVSGKK